MTGPANPEATPEPVRAAPAGPAPRGLIARIAEAWRAGPRASTARELASDPPEGRILAYGVGACMVQGLVAAAGAPEKFRGEDATGQVAGAIVAAVFFAPLFLYGIAALLRMGLRALGGTGGWKDTRHAIFWASFAATPAYLLAAVAEAWRGAAGLGAIPEGAPGVAAGAVALWFWCAALAEAHGFRRAWPGFAFGVALVTALILGGGA